MNRSPYKAVLFDLDDTLVDRRAAYDHAYRCFYESQPAISESTSWQAAREFFWSLSPNNATDPRTAIVEIMRRWPGVKSDPDTHRRYYFEKIIEGVAPLPGVPDFLAALNRAKVLWGVVTNGDWYQFRKVEKAGFTKVIPFVLASQIFGVEKPGAAIYHEAVRLLGLEKNRADGGPVSEVLELPVGGAHQSPRPSRASGHDYGDILFAGDNLHTDIAGAHGVGMKTAWVCMGREYDFDAPRPDHVIESVVELGPLLGL